jgi:hypothetical protein
LKIDYCPDITSPEAVIVAKGLNLFGKLARELDCMPMFINVAGTSGKIVMSKLDNALFFVHDEMCHMSSISTRRKSYGTGEEQTTKVTQLLDGLEERVESLFEELATLKLNGAIEVLLLMVGSSTMEVMLPSRRESGLWKRSVRLSMPSRKKNV